MEFGGVALLLIMSLKIVSLKYLGIRNGYSFIANRIVGPVVKYFE
jgi:hypothetical protein